MTTKPKRYSEEEINEARDLRKSGKTYREISEATGMSLSTLRPHISDLPNPPRKSKSESMSPAEYRRQIDAERKADRHRNTLYGSDNDGTGSDDAEHLSMPSHGRYPIHGDRPSPGLLQHSKRLLASYDKQKTEGRIFTRRPVAVSQAWLVLQHWYNPQSKDWFLANRSQWRSIRETAGIGLVEMGKRVNASSSTVRRWENGERTPGANEAARLQQAYCAAHEEALQKTELLLAVDDAYETIANDQGIDISEIEVHTDTIFQWIAGLDDNGEPATDEFNIDHLHHLNYARSLMPYPQWRNQDPGNFYLDGYQRPATAEAG